MCILCVGIWALLRPTKRKILPPSPKKVLSLSLLHPVTSKDSKRYIVFSHPLKKGECSLAL